MKKIFLSFVIAGFFQASNVVAAADDGGDYFCPIPGVELPFGWETVAGAWDQVEHRINTHPLVASTPTADDVGRVFHATNEASLWQDSQHENYYLVCRYNSNADPIIITKTIRDDG